MTLISNRFNDNPPNFWWRIIIPAFIAAIGGLICYLTSIDDKFLSAWISIPFTITKAVLDHWAVKIAEKQAKMSEHKIHAKYAISKVLQLRENLIKKSYPISALISALNDLESILTDVWNCCLDGAKSNFHEHKGIVSAYKTAIAQSKVDKSINPNISRFLVDLERIETQLRESI